ncbi:hypothetical protein [Enterobacter ludwigii]|uniref:hypothetical protein n=1 Tax=Enterobacter ludwigii TaxID=299767 RepID=UPI001E3F4797|nr:hypothetical protein [Enterobacter ludwigii]MCE1916573.1 hypothetical protein [Enterobacter ludwigii]
MSANNPFDLDVLQAINDWQINYKFKRAKALKESVKGLPLKYKTCSHACYRKIELNQKGVFSLVGKAKLNEKISSWSSSVDVVKTFKHGVTLKNDEQSFIVRYTPTSSEVIVNLEVVYQCPLFHSAVEKFQSSIKNFNKGIGEFGDKQKEIVLEVEYVTRDNIYMMGGRSSDINMIFANQVIGWLPDGSTIAVYDDCKSFCIFKWIDPAQTVSALDKTLKRSGQIIPYNVFSKGYGL